MPASQAEGRGFESLLPLQAVYKGAKWPPFCIGLPPMRIRPTFALLQGDDAWWASDSIELERQVE